MLQLNRAKFSANGNCGYVLKPQCMCQGEARGPGTRGGQGAAAAGSPGGPPGMWLPRMPEVGVRRRVPTLPGVGRG